MTGTDLPDDDHVVRYAKPTTVREDGSVDGSAFRLRPSDRGLSVNWLDYYQRLKSLQLIHAPLDAEGDYQPDPSHSEIRGLRQGILQRRR